jgi:hypothetical protein
MRRAAPLNFLSPLLINCRGAATIGKAQFRLDADPKGTAA